MGENAKYTFVGSIILILLALGMGTLVWIGPSKIDSQDSKKIYAFFKSAGGLTVGSPVKFQGITVGNVSSLVIDQNHSARIQALLDIDPKVIIKEDAAASIEMQGLTGGSFVQIHGGSKNARELKSKKGFIPTIGVVESRFEGLLTAAPLLLQELTGLTKDLREMLNGENRETIKSILENADKFLGTLVQNRENISEIIFSLRETFKKAPSLINKTITTINEASTFFQESKISVNKFSNGIESIEKLSDVLLTIVQENERSINNFLSVGFSQAIKVTSSLNASISNFNRFLAFVKQFMSSLTGQTTTKEYILDEQNY